MNTHKQKIQISLLVLIGGISICAFGLWRYRTVNSVLPSHQAYLADSSASTGTDCACLESLVSQELADARLMPSSTVSILQTGDESSANEPVPVAEYTAPAERAMVEKQEKIAATKAELLQDLKQKCEGMKRTNRSPIFQAIRRSVEHLKAKGCGPGSDCRLRVITDGEELVEPGLRKALHRTGDLDSISLPAPIHNEGIQVVFIGVAQTTGRRVKKVGESQQYTRDRSPQAASRLEAVWRQVFTEPQRVSFEPFCRPRTEAVAELSSRASLQAAR